MRTVHTIAELREQIGQWRRAGERIALVPTMGNLHRGHLRLVEHARQQAQRVVASVFVNPLQFGPNEDFGRYPRTLAQDQAQLTAAGCDLLFAPDEREVYPRGRDALCSVVVPASLDILEGECRPGHFNGVATVVSILFHLTQPDVALFGQKDYQQLLVIRRMVADLHLPIEIVGVATEREADGLAMSSRNQYLTTEQRTRAASLHAALSLVAAGLRSGRRDFEKIAEDGVKMLVDSEFKPQYLEIRRPDLAQPTATDGQFVVLAAAVLGQTRLIDNLSVECVDSANVTGV
ncbi:pantoate--beta-alanine ligase [Sinimarinibacterium sp. CAU 1509]|uniref:pantoate--beta-alanine ligase n=1 Tax=Sinimarinibacterium sp. CAU 1509 TaxID=2562283 RepID=UPI0010ABC2DD|nr:pantoate--beta-alanine ligase [Sinimarinibacterium sp. CAU 1509]TJY61167.1 pantoate--beta-alanine ligase [Sinimarinibacterium sp. CAU 1509]